MDEDILIRKRVEKKLINLICKGELCIDDLVFTADADIEEVLKWESWYDNDRKKEKI